MAVSQVAEVGTEAAQPVSVDPQTEVAPEPELSADDEMQKLANGMNLAESTFLFRHNSDSSELETLSLK